MLFLVLGAAESTISTVQDLDKMRNNSSGYFLLLNDMDLVEFSGQIAYFSGIFNGDNHTITIGQHGPLIIAAVGATFYNLIFVNTKSAVFGALQDSMLKNMVFAGQCADSASNIAVISTQFSTMKSVVFSQSRDSRYVGLFIEGYKQMFDASTSDSFSQMLVSISMDPESASSPTPCAVAYSIVNVNLMRVRISYQQVLLSSFGYKMIGVIAVNASNVQLREVDVYGNVTAQNATFFGGFFSTIQSSTLYQTAPKIFNSSCAIVADIQNSIATGTCYIGAITGRLSARSHIENGISVFFELITTQIKYSKLRCGGVIGSGITFYNLTEVYAMMNYNIQGHLVYFGGIMAQSTDQTAYGVIKKCVVVLTGNLKVTAESNLGAIYGSVGNSYLLSRSSVHGNINATIIGKYSDPMYVGGAIGENSLDGEINSFYSTVSIFLAFEKGLAPSMYKLYVGGLGGVFTNTAVIACLVASRTIHVKNPLTNILVGGLIGVATIIQSTESQALIEKIIVEREDFNANVIIGGLVGQLASTSFLDNLFVRANIELKNTSNEMIGAGIGHSVQSIHISWSDSLILVTSVGTPISYVAHSDVKMLRVVIECTEHTNIVEKVPQCNSTNLQHENALALFNEGAWMYDAKMNGGYPSLLNAITNGPNRTLAMPSTNVYYIASEFLIDGGLLMPQSSTTFIRGASSGSGATPASYKCADTSGTPLCLQDGAALLFKQHYSQPSFVPGIGQALYCSNNQELADHECKSTCPHTCVYGQCINGNCLCDYAFTGDSCDQENCAASDNPCNRQGICRDGRCICNKALEIYEYDTHSCVYGCQDLVHGICTARNVFTCLPGYVTVARPCDSCENGHAKLGSICVENMLFFSSLFVFVLGGGFLTLITIVTLWIWKRKIAERNARRPNYILASKTELDMGEVRYVENSS